MFTEQFSLHRFVRHLARVTTSYQEEALADNCVFVGWCSSDLVGGWFGAGSSYIMRILRIKSEYYESTNLNEELGIKNIDLRFKESLRRFLGN